MKELIGMLGASSNRAIGFCLGVLVAAGRLKPSDVDRRWIGVSVDTKKGLTVTLSGDSREEVFCLDSAGALAADKSKKEPEKPAARKKTASKSE